MTDHIDHGRRQALRVPLAVTLGASGAVLGFPATAHAAAGLSPEDVLKGNALLSAILETQAPQRLGTGFAFAEGPIWDPKGFFYFTDPRGKALHKVVPGQASELVRKTSGANGVAFDLQGRLLQCEGDFRRVTRWDPKAGTEEVFVDNASGKRFNRPNDVVVRADGTVLFTDPERRVPFAEREVNACIWKVAPDGKVSVFAECEYPNGLAFSSDERKLYVANTRSLKYVEEFELRADGSIAKRRFFADMSFDDAPGSPDGIKVDAAGQVFCTGPGGIWVFSPAGERLGIIRCHEPAVNFAFGGNDLRTLLICAHTSVYTLRVKTPGVPTAWARVSGRA